MKITACCLAKNINCANFYCTPSLHEKVTTWTRACVHGPPIQTLNGSCDIHLVGRNPFEDPCRRSHQWHCVKTNCSTLMHKKVQPGHKFWQTDWQTYKIHSYNFLPILFFNSFTICIHSVVCGIFSVIDENSKQDKCESFYYRRHSEKIITFFCFFFYFGSFVCISRQL